MIRAEIKAAPAKKLKAPKVDLIAKALAEYEGLPEVSQDPKSWDNTIAHLVFRAQHEIDLVEEDERNEDPMPKTNERKIRAFIKKWAGK